MGLLSAIKDKASSALHGAENVAKDAAKGVSNAVGDLGKGAMTAAGDMFHGTVQAVKTAGGDLEKAGSSIAEGVTKGAQDVAEGVKTGHVLSGIVKAQQDVAHGGGEALSDTWHSATDLVGGVAGAGMKGVKDAGEGVSHAYDSGLDGVSRAVTDVAGKKAGDFVHTAGEAVANPVRQAAQFQYGLTDGLGKGLGGIVRGTGDLVVGAVRVGSDSEYRDKLIANVGKTATALGKLGEQAIQDPGGTARKLGTAVETGVGNIVKSGEAAAANGTLAEWAGEGVGEVVAQVATTVVAPEAEGAALAADAGRGVELLGDVAKGAEALSDAGRGAEALTGAGKLAGAAERSGSDALENLATRDKHEFVLVDSGSGGAMTAGKLEGTVPQVAATYPLPLGSKPAEQATAATAAMILDPMIHPVAGAAGKADAVADHVIIACNSASVRMDGALPKIEQYVADVKANPGNYDLVPEHRANTVALADKIEADPNYLRSHVHEVATPTAKEGANRAVDALTGARGAEKPDYFVRVDSTNGTVQSNSYQANMRDNLTQGFRDKGYEPVGEPVSSAPQIITGAAEEPTKISHQMLTFRNEAGDTRRVFVENRGNPDWVPAIEKGTLARDGDRLVTESNSYSDRAVAGLGDGFPADAKTIFNGAPDLNLLSCTHYPAMQGALESGARAPGEFLNQADIVKDIVDNRIRGSEPGARAVEREINPGLEVVQTIGSRAENAQQFLKTEGVLANPNSDKAIAELGRREGVVKRVIDRIRGNHDAEVRVQVPTKQREDAFEQLHRHMGLQEDTAGPIARQQGYEVVHDAPDGAGNINVRSATTLRDDLAMPAKVPNVHADVAAAMQAGAAPRIGELAQLGTTGEQRGIAVLSTAVDTGAQLEASASRLGSVVLRNAEKAPGEAKESVGILTGFQVINKETRLPMGGENDGPAGAVVMAKNLVDSGTPVSLITDTGSRQSLMESLVGAGLARPGQEAGTYALRDGVKVHVANTATETMEGYTSRIKDALAGDNTTTLVSIERPSPNLESKLHNMGGQDITPHNADLSGLMTKEGNYQPYTIGIGDGGNELGLGSLHGDITGLRLPNLERVVKNGEQIASSPRFPADAVVLNSVSNNGGVSLSMATRAATGARGFESDVATYDRVIRHLHDKGISIDGVEQKNLLSVDGRDLGTLEDSALNPQRLPGQPGATHHDMFREMQRIMER